MAVKASSDSQGIDLDVSEDHQLLFAAGRAGATGDPLLWHPPCNECGVIAGHRRAAQCQRQGVAECGEVNALLDEHIGHVATRIRELRQLEKQLKALREQCAGSSEAARCGILNELVQASSVPAAAAAKVPGHHVGGSHTRGGRRQQ